MELTFHAARARIRTFAIAWTVLCVVLGLLVAAQVLAMRSGAEALDDVGVGLATTSESLDELAELPLVGSAIGDAAEVVQSSGRSVRASADDVDRSLLLLAIFSGLSIALLPTVPVLMLWWLTRPAARDGA